MGIYLNPGNKGFWESIRSEIYVDKTGLIAHTNNYMNTRQKFICVSRPRRFGKSMALEMLAAYYSCGCDSRDLFRGKEIERVSTFEEYLNQYDVIYLNMQQFLIRAKKRQNIWSGLWLQISVKFMGSCFPRRKQTLPLCWSRFIAGQAGSLSSWLMSGTV